MQLALVVRFCRALEYLLRIQMAGTYFNLHAVTVAVVCGSGSGFGCDSGSWMWLQL